MSSSPVATLKQAGESSVGPLVLATLLTSLHLRPFQPLPMLFPPVFLFTSYLNLSGFKIDAAGTSAAWSVVYLALAARRRPVQGLRGKFSARGAVSAVAMVGCGAQAVAGGTAYVLGRRAREEEKRAKGEAARG